MRRWWADTLFKRLFLLMWFGLVASHLVAFLVTRQVIFPQEGTDAFGMHLPVLPSLPPMGAPPGEADRGPHGESPGAADRGPRGESTGAADRGPRGEPSGTAVRGPHAGGPRGLPASALWLDYGIRFLAIGVVAWFGARWLATPMRRLAEASEGLGRALGSGQRGPLLDAGRGTREVRQTAQVFNTMAERLQSQFAAQGLLMAAISHDLRTPLARLRMRLETMDGQPQAERGIADVREMDVLIGSVLGMLRDQHSSAERHRIDLAALAQSMVDDLVEQGAPAQLTHTEAAIVSAQPAALTRVLDNLIGNALRHGGGARVSVAVRGSEVRVAVDDDGPGIPTEHLEAVFEPFHRLDTARHRSVAAAAGSGLGLYIARDLAQRNGARLTLANRPEGGLRAELAMGLER